jgi:hypothetical protein
VRVRVIHVARGEHPVGQVVRERDRTVGRWVVDIGEP